MVCRIGGTLYTLASCFLLRSSHVDPLSQTVSLLHPRALRWKCLEARGPWRIDFPGHDGIVFCLVIQGDCLLRAQGAAEWLSEGSFLFLREPPAWSLGDGSEVPALLREDLPRDDLGVTHLDAGDGPLARLIGGYFSILSRHKALLEACLPGRLIVRAEAGHRLRALLGLLGEEATGRRPGADLMQERLLELILMESIRHGGCAPDVRAPLLDGLADPRLSRALHAMHEDIAYPWTVAELAQVAHLSRSVFARRFQQLLGDTPIRYLQRWRLARAKEALIENRQALAHIALDCGYQSLPAFSAAFTREVGCPPSRFARLIALAECAS